MSQTPTAIASIPNYQGLFENALEAYKKKTKEDLRSHPLLPKLQTCDSPDAVLTLLRDQIPMIDPSPSTGGDDSRLTKWLNPTVHVLYTFSEAICAGISLVYPPAGVIFTGIGVLLSAAKAVSASQDALTSVFERIENSFRRLETYVQVPPTPGMADMIVKIMIEVLSILAIATKEISQSRSKKYLIGRADIEDGLGRLDRLTQEEARMAAVQGLKATHAVHDEVKSVGDHIQQAVQDVGGDVQQVDIHVQRVDDKVQGVDDKVQQVADDIGDQKRDQLGKDLRIWLSPPDPSVNYEIASDVRHEGTALWVLGCDAFKYWKAHSSLLWIHGKPGSGKTILSSSIIQDLRGVVDTGSAHVAYFFFDYHDTGKQGLRGLLSSLLVQLSHQSPSFCDILSTCYSTHQSGAQQPSERALIQCLQDMIASSEQTAIYLILDALDECPNTIGIPSSRNKVLALVKELVKSNLPNLHLCITSRPEIDIQTSLEPLTSNRIYLHDQGGQKKDIIDYVASVVYSDNRMRRWREEDKKLVIDGLSERADGMFRWVFCQLQMLRYSFPSSVRQILAESPESLDETYERILREIPKSNRVHAHRLLQCIAVAVRPLHVEELAEILAVDFNTSEGIPKLNEAWRWEDQEQAILSACSNLIAVIEDEDQVARVVQFSHFSIKEFLTSDRLATSKMDASRYHHIPLDPAHTIMAQACLGALLRFDSHIDEARINSFPLPEYAAEHFGDHAEFRGVLWHIRDGVDALLDADKSHFAAWVWMSPPSQIRTRNRQWMEIIPLYYVAARGYRGLVDYLISKRPGDVNVRGHYGTPLHAALGGAHGDIARLFLGYCVDVDVRDYEDVTPLHLAAYHGFLDFIRTLVERNAVINVRDSSGNTPLHRAMENFEEPESVQDKSLDVVKFLLEHGADPDAKNDLHSTPLHQASYYGSVEGARLMLEHGANVHARSWKGRTPLHRVLASLDDAYDTLDIFFDTMRCLLAHGADIDAPDDDHATPLHLAACFDRAKAAQLLLEHGANVHLEDKWGRTPLQVASEWDRTEITQLLLEHS